ncbi:ser/Thr protein phosphatase superfamily [Didymella exigua CBS 183.55]|uniref:Ser/Thr protein phosphatase superfamily n=1 Tax=Didymella exigua CBS 183.55 TaxID=1150837 RepID=A0A6A5R8M9_9PLEO|nr:ser/Thr protein phosphatase superfamily [Didymella exigua CBS 183.55]KAF1923056.1 ser/Thr protein phosphatase superfamily [Didymella exigua CBS 183.55]
MVSHMRRISGLFSHPKTSFQVLSDLHLDHESQYLTFHIPVSAPFLILAGNIGRLIDYESYLSFLIRRCNLHEKVFLVLGSLEFHGLAWMDGLQLAHKMEREPATKGRLEVLYETRSEVPGTNVVLLGATLWSRIPDQDVAAVLKKMPEFNEESGIQGEWSIENHNAEYKRDLRWLKQEVGKATKPAVGPDGKPMSGFQAGSEAKQVVVVTSFAPDLRESLDPWQVDTPWSSAYGTDLLNGTEWSGVKTWICGTTGRTCEFKKNGITVVCNQRGREGDHVTGLLKDGMTEKQKLGLFDVMRVFRV